MQAARMPATRNLEDLKAFSVPAVRRRRFQRHTFRRGRNGRVDCTQTDSCVQNKLRRADLFTHHDEQSAASTARASDATIGNGQTRTGPGNLVSDGGGARKLTVGGPRNLVTDGGKIARWVVLETRCHMEVQIAHCRW